jgi:hypothetical protein
MRKIRRIEPDSICHADAGAETVQVSGKIRIAIVMRVTALRIRSGGPCDRMVPSDALLGDHDLQGINSSEIASAQRVV